MQLNRATLDGLYKTYRTLYDAGYNAATPIYKNFVTEVPSGTTIQEIDWLGAVPGMRKLVGEIAIRNLKASNWTVKSEEFESTVSVKQLDILTDKYGVYGPLMTMMGDAAAYHPDELVAQILINGFSQKCYTGKSFFATDHKLEGAKSSFSNRATAKLSPASYQAARVNLLGRKNSEDRPMGLGRKLKLIVSPSNEAMALSILQAELIAQTQKNVAGTENVGVTSVSNTFKGTSELVVWSQLASNPDMWFLVETGFVMRPLLFQPTIPTKFNSLTDETSDHVFKRKEYLYQAYVVYTAAYGMPEFAYGSDGTTAG